MIPDAEACYRAVQSRDRRLDGRVFLGVTSTGIYCRPSCPARTPLARHCRFYSSAAAAVSAGFRACRRCRPDLVPGNPEWDHRSDLAARALRLVRDGVVDEVGVAGLAERLHVSERHLHRTLLAEVGVGPLALARTRRAQVARLLVEQTPMTLTEVSAAAGFGSLRQFNDVMAAEFGCPPSALRRREDDGRAPVADGPALVLRLPFREPVAADAVLAHLTARLVAGVEVVDDGLCRRVSAPSGPAVVTLGRPRRGRWPVTLRLHEVTDVAVVVGSVRRWLDLDADPLAVDAALGSHPVLRPHVARHPGLRVPATPTPFEAALRAVVGQRVSLAAGNTVLARLVAALGPTGPALGRLGLRPMPEADEVAGLTEAALRSVGLPQTRARALLGLASAVAGGSVPLDGSVPNREVQTRLTALPGIGGWTAQLVLLRGLADPDAFPTGDLVLQRALATAGAETGAQQRALVAAWSPWRAYAAQHLWTNAMEAT